MTSCPICHKPVDPLRAPAVGVRDGKVVSYCSKECAAAAESRPIPIASPTATTTPTAAPAQSSGPATPPPAPRATPAKGVAMVGGATPARGVATVDPTPPPQAPSKRAASAPITSASAMIANASAMVRRTPPGGIPKATVSADSGPVIEILHEPASGVVTSTADARSGAVANAKRVETDGAIQIAETGELDDYIAHQPSRRAWWLVLALVFAAAGAGFAAYRLGYLDTFLHRKPAAAAPQPAAVVDAPAPPPPDPQLAAHAAVDRARTVLRAELHSDSPRVQRVAASALARTGDPEAISQLAIVLASETSDIAKLDIAYALARGGDKRGVDALVAALGAARRDVKAEAARRLALLGDPRAVATLAEFLPYAQFKLGAAEQLALLAEPRALKVLDALVADDNAGADDRARAAIALGLAGRDGAKPMLHKLLADTRFSAFAAAALAALHDDSARAVLLKQLAIPSLRVGAARALRQLDPTLDPGAVVSDMMNALTSGKDTDQVQAAEAILLLAGPVAWSARE